MNVNSNYRQVEEDLFILSFQKLTITAQMSGTFGHREELPVNLRNFRKNSETSGPTSSDTLKVLQEQVGVCTKLLDTLMG